MGVLEQKLWPQQKLIYDTVRALPVTTTTAVLLCARQFGKSVLGCLLAIEDCLQNPDVVVMIIGPTIKQTRAIVRPRVKLLTKDAPEGLIREVKSEDTWYFSNGSELKLGGFETSSAAQRGKTLHKVYLEEIGADSNPDLYNDFIRSDLGPALTHSLHSQIIYLTTPPKIPDHPFLLETVPQAQLTNSFFKFTIYDNKQLTENQFDACVKNAGGTHTVEWKREYLCEVVRDSTIILAPEFDETRHVKPIIKPEHAIYYLGGDLGGTNDRSAIFLCCWDFKRAKTLFLDQVEFPPETSTSVIVAATKAMCEGYQIRARWIDSPGLSLVDLAQQYQFPCALPKKESQEATVNLVRLALQNDEIEIDPKCQMLIQTLRSGTWNKQRTDLARTTTLGHMDSFQAAAYCIRMVIKSNPYPPLGGANHYTHYISDSSPARTISQKTILSLFKA